MPNRDGSGNVGRGRGVGRIGAGRGQNIGGNRPLGSDVCTCPKCGHQMPHAQRGVPCTQIACPKCKTLMEGEFC